MTGKRYDANIDHEEIARFDARASRWWDRDGEFKPLHAINPLRLNYIDEKAGLAGKTVLDVGCGGGILSESMARRGAKVTGIDMGEASLAVARLHSLETGVEVNYQGITAEQLADEQPASFDVVTCLEMLEHVPDPGRIVDACARLVKPDGHVFLATLNRTARSWLFAIVGAEYLLKLLPAGTHRHSRFIRPHELAGWCRSAGLDISQMTGMVYNPLTGVYRLKEQNLEVNYLVHAGKKRE